MNRFETNKRKLNYVTFDDFYKCAFAMIDYWNSPTAAGGGSAVGVGGVSTGTAKQDSDDTVIDRDFLMHLRELKCLMDREKEHKR